MNSQEILEQIESEIARLQQVKSLLQGSNGRQQGSAARFTPGKDQPAEGKVKRVLSLAARRKIAAAQRRRWAKARKAQAQAR